MRPTNIKYVTITYFWPEEPAKSIPSLCVQCVIPPSIIYIHVLSRWLVGKKDK